MLSHFFRTGSEGRVFPLFSSIHFAMLFSVGFFILLLYLFRGTIRKHEKLDKGIRISIVALIILENTLFYGWHLFTNPTPIREILPLYTCRLVEILVIFMLLTGKKRFFIMPYYWGILGGLSSFLLPDVGRYAWPHITYLSFYVGHLMIIIGPLYGLLVSKYSITREGFYYFLKFSYAFYFFTLLINLLIEGNYAFLLEPPLAAQEAGYQPSPIFHFLVYTTIYTLVSSLFYWIPHFFSSFKKKKIKVS